MKFGYCYETVIGVLCFMEASGKLLRCSLSWDERCTQKETPIIKQAVSEVMEFLNGERTDFSVPCQMTGTAFEQSVYQALRQVPFGETICYQDLAKRINRPKSVRAVGNALGKNPLLLFTPCHRVLASDGTLGGFTGGLEVKKVLLRIEGTIHAD